MGSGLCHEVEDLLLRGRLVETLHREGVNHLHRTWSRVCTDPGELRVVGGEPAQLVPQFVELGV